MSTAIALGVDDDNQRTTTTYPNGVVVQRGYEQPAGRLDFIKATKGSTVLQHESYVYAYEAEGSSSAGQGVMRIRTIDHKTNRSTRYQYDGRNRLIRARTYTTGGTVPSAADGCYAVGALACYEYAYDAASNRTTRITTGHDIPNTTTSFNYNDANQLLTKTGQPAGTPNYTYDANGNQLTRPTSSSALRAMAYNPRDQASTIAGASLGFLGAGQDQPISEGSLSLRHDLLGLDERVNATTTDDYTREIDGTPLSQRTTTGSSSSSEYYLADVLGSITATTDSTGSAQATYAYDPDGNTTNTTGTSTNPLGYAAGYKGTGRPLPLRPTLLRPRRRPLDPTRPPQPSNRPTRRQPLRIRRSQPHQSHGSERPRSSGCCERLRRRYKQQNRAARSRLGQSRKEAHKGPSRSV